MKTYLESEQQGNSIELLLAALGVTSGVRNIVTPAENIYQESKQDTLRWLGQLEQQGDSIAFLRAALVVDKALFIDKFFTFPEPSFIENLKTMLPKIIDHCDQYPSLDILLKIVELDTETLQAVNFFEHRDSILALAGRGGDVSTVIKILTKIAKPLADSLTDEQTKSLDPIVIKLLQKTYFTAADAEFATNFANTLTSLLTNVLCKGILEKQATSVDGNIYILNTHCMVLSKQHIGGHFDSTNSNISIVFKGDIKLTASYLLHTSTYAALFDLFKNNVNPYVIDDVESAARAQALINVGNYVASHPGGLDWFKQVIQYPISKQHAGIFACAVTHLTQETLGIAEPLSGFAKTYTDTILDALERGLCQDNVQFEEPECALIGKEDEKSDFSD